MILVRLSAKRRSIPLADGLSLAKSNFLLASLINSEYVLFSIVFALHCFFIF